MHGTPKKAETQYYCNECKQSITYGEFNFSTKNFDMPLCRDCQPEIEEKVSVAPKKFQGTYKIEVSGNPPKKE
jgi:NAD-dependent SIR2 family protein deacetylase